ncbi:hypothetical protein KKF84_03635 [Myxococcota bacterium]|nr:hypothetical protein [Myxococcota bacterium]MBU1534384.1 hypothetical protein [Myxococcota bacterium]
MENLDNELRTPANWALDSKIPNNLEMPQSYNEQGIPLFTRNQVSSHGRSSYYHKNQFYLDLKTLSRPYYIHEGTEPFFQSDGIDYYWNNSVTLLYTASELGPIRLDETPIRVETLQGLRVELYAPDQQLGIWHGGYGEIASPNIYRILTTLVNRKQLYEAKLESCDTSRRKKLLNSTVKALNECVRWAQNQGLLKAIGFNGTEYLYQGDRCTVLSSLPPTGQTQLHRLPPSSIVRGTSIWEPALLCQVSGIVYDLTRIRLD